MNVLLHTFGCKANQYDTEALRQRLEAAGCRVVGSVAEADAAVVNTCTVTHVGEGKMRALVRRLARRSPGIRTVLMGCASAVDDGRLARLPGVAAVVPGADEEAVARSLGVTLPEAGPLHGFASQGRAWIKVQDGCDEHCTFCATVVARGASRSREPGALAEEAALLAERHAEIVLTGVHLGAYGRDLGTDWSLARLVTQLVERVPEVRFRLSSVEATEVDEALVDLMAGAPERLAPHLHAPLQSGSDLVLRRMGRRWYTAAAYARRIEAIASRVAPLGLGADVMVGFPGESHADHRATVDLVRGLPFSYLHVFPYSPRPDTAAPRLGAAPVASEVRERGAELRALSDGREAAHRAARAGGGADLVLEGRRAAHYDALTEDYLSVRVPTDAPWASGRRRVWARLAERDGALVAEAA